MLDSFLSESPTVKQEYSRLIVSGILLALAWPPLPLGFLSYIALILPFDIISGKKFGAAFRSGYLFAFTYHLFSLYWIGTVTIPGMVAAVAIISIYSAFMLALFAGAYRLHKLLALVILPFLWIGVEYFRTLGEIAFPWSNLSYTQWAYKPFIQICEFTGDSGISFIIVCVNILLWRALRSSYRTRSAMLAFIAGLLVVIPTIYGVYRLTSMPEESDEHMVRIALLQGNIPLDIKWNPEDPAYNAIIYDSLADVAGPADLIVWPETAMPVYLLSDPYLRSLVASSARTHSTPLLVGMLDYIRPSPNELYYYNAATQFDADGAWRRAYHKNKLVPFAETVPYGNYIPWLANLSMGWSDFEHGAELVVYENHFGDYGTLICYEVIFPEVVNRYVRQGAEFFVNITNDTWYGWTSGAYQHGIMAVFRAIENRVYLVRAANSGFSYLVDRYGRIYNKTRLFEQAVAVGDLYASVTPTVFNRTGPLLGRIGLLVLGLVTIFLGCQWIAGKIRNRHTSA